MLVLLDVDVPDDAADDDLRADPDTTEPDGVGVELAQWDRELAVDREARGDALTVALKVPILYVSFVSVSFVPLSRVPGTNLTPGVPDETGEPLTVTDADGETLTDARLADRAGERVANGERLLTSETVP